MASYRAWPLGLWIRLSVMEQVPVPRYQNLRSRRYSARVDQAVRSTQVDQTNNSGRQFQYIEYLSPLTPNAHNNTGFLQRATQIAYSSPDPL